jgi:hypothetical protein
MPNDIGFLSRAYLHQLEKDNYELQEKSSLTYEIAHSLWNITIETWFLTNTGYIVSYLEFIAYLIQTEKQVDSDYLLECREKFASAKELAWDTLKAPNFMQTTKNESISAREYCRWAYERIENWDKLFMSMAQQLESFERTLPDGSYVSLLQKLIFYIVEIAADMKSVKTTISSLYSEIR